MYAKFKLSFDNELDYYYYYWEGSSFYESYKNKLRCNLENFVNSNGIIDGNKLQMSWFPTFLNFDVFLSHSHNEEKRAIALAGFLKKKLNLTTFIDSCLWGYIDDLLYKIDCKYCLQEDNKYFNYKKRNFSTSHVHMMLSTAISTMIDKCECLFFLNTPNTILLEDNINNQQISSPWIYNELILANIMRSRSKEDHRKQKRLAEDHKIIAGLENFSVPIMYNIPEQLKNFIPLTFDELETCARNWIDEKENYENSLDYLYFLKE